MPRLKQPATLRDQCVKFVASNLPKIISCTFGLEHDLNSSDDFERSEKARVLQLLILSKEFYHENPFEAIPSMLIEEIINHKPPSRDHHLIPFLMTSRITKVSWGTVPLGDTIVKVLQTRHSWQARELVWNEQKPPPATLLHKFSNLQEICGNLNDKNLTTIAKSCPLIRSLEVTNSASVSDGGLKALSRLKRLTRLSFGRAELCYKVKPRITAKGIRHLLDNCKSLRVVDYVRLIEILAEIQLGAAKKGTELCYDLRELCYGLYENEFTLDPEIGRPFPRAVRLCPRVKSVTLRSANQLYPSDVEALVSVKELLNLEIDASLQRWSGVRITFVEHLVPVLQKHGQNLRSVFMQSVRDVNLELLTHLCPKLSALNMFGCEFSNYWPESIHKPLKAIRATQLVTVRVVHNNSDVPAHHWQCILSSQFLESVTILQSDTLSDEILRRVMKVNRFPNLRNLSFDSVAKVTVDSLWRLISFENPLKFISYPMGPISEPAEFVNFKEYCDANFDIKIDVG